MGIYFLCAKLPGGLPLSRTAPIWAGLKVQSFLYVGFSYRFILNSHPYRESILFIVIVLQIDIGNIHFGISKWFLDNVYMSVG